MTVTLGGSGGQPGEAFGTPGGTGLVAGLSAAAGAAAWGWLLARVGGGRRGTSGGEGGMPGPSPRLARRVSRAGGGRGSCGPGALTGPRSARGGRGRGRREQSPGPAAAALVRPAARPETREVPGEGSLGAPAPTGGLRRQWAPGGGSATSTRRPRAPRPVNRSRSLEQGLRGGWSTSPQWVGVLGPETVVSP